MQSPQNESGSRDVILDPEQIDAFHRHGFVVVPQMSDAAEVAELREGAVDTISERGDNGTGGWYGESRKRDIGAIWWATNYAPKGSR